MLLTAFTAAGTAAWADGYFRYGDNDNIGSWSNSVSASGSGPYTATISGLTAKKKYFVAYATTNSTSGVSKTAASIGTTSGLQNSGTQEHDGYRFVWFETNTATSVNISCTSGRVYSITAAVSSYTVTPSVTGGTISPSTAQSVTAGNSISFTVTPTSGYTYFSATYSGSKSGDITRSTNTFTFTPTSSGTISIVYVNSVTYTVSTAGSNCSFNESSKSIASDGYFDFVVTPNDGYKLVSASCTNATCSPTSLGNVTTATTVRVSNPTAAGTLTIVTAPVSVNRAPTVRVGAKPTISGSDCGLTATAYFAQRGCNDIDKLTLYYSNSRAFRIDGKNKTASKEISVTSPSSPTINSSRTISLTSAEISEVVDPGDMLYLRFTAHNSIGTSSYSDILPIKYECNKFIKKNLTKSFTACPGMHEFNWSEMFISPAPATWDVTLGGSDAKSDFNLANGVMTWKTDGKSSSSYTYTFTAHADGYDDASATLTITYTVPSGSVSGSISGVTATPATTSESPTKPYTEISLSAAGTQGNITLIDWTVSPATAQIYNKSGNSFTATAKFKAESRATKTTYTVTATGYNSTCKSVSKSATIVVAPDVTETCD